MLIFVSIMVLVFIALTYLMIRNDWVYKKQMEIINNWYDRAMGDIEAGIFTSIEEAQAEYGVDAYISYNEMLYNKFWIWDIEKLKKNP